MQTYTQFFSTLNKDGRKYLVNVYEWADMTLTGDRRAQYLADFEEFNSHYENYKNSREFSLEPIYSSATFISITTPIQIGIRYTWKTQADENSKFEYWQTQFANDPFINYRAVSLES